MPKDTCNLISRLLHAQREPPSSRPPRPAHRPAVRAAAAAAGGGEGAGTRSTGQLVGCVTEAEEDSYSRHLADIFPPHSLPDGQIVSELAAGGEVRGGRYSIRDLAVGCLTTNATYRTRGKLGRFQPSCFLPLPVLPSPSALLFPYIPPPTPFSGFPRCPPSPCPQLPNCLILLPSIRLPYNLVAPLLHTPPPLPPTP